MFIDDLRRLQRQSGLNQKGFAANRRVSQTLLSRLYAGKIKWYHLELVTLWRLCRDYPSLREAVQDFLKLSVIPSDDKENA